MYISFSDLRDYLVEIESIEADGRGTAVKATKTELPRMETR